MRKIVIRLAAGILLLLLALGPLVPATGQPVSLPVQCQDLAFSTEEDFVTQGPVPPGGNVISDGDLLGANCTLCARNADLLAAFLPQIPPEQRPDLGLDAADVLDAETSLVAFSTSLNSPYQGQFTAGDLLFTTGLIVPNQALTHAFGQGAITYDIGLDAVHFLGTLQDILTFLNAWAEQQPPVPPDQLSVLLKRYNVDIWYSTEGTWSAAGATMILDGDLLSARDGIVVVHNSQLLPPSVPAGIPDRGVDFGLDAVTADRGGYRQMIHFSTELLFDGEFSFSDGDVLKLANGVVYPHKDLITCFEPRADFVGLDALHLALEVLPGEVQGKKFHDLDADGLEDPAEPGLEGWEIHLDGTDSAGNPVNRQTLTGATGTFTFTVAPGVYEVSEVCPAVAAWYQSKPAPVENVCGTGVYSVTVTPGDGPQTGIDFGNYQYVSKSGHKFEDLNRNGIWDLDERPLGQWEIRLEGQDGMLNPVNIITYTDGDGYYSFAVPPGSYTVRELCPPEWSQSKPATTAGCGTGVYEFKPLSGDEPHLGNDFGNFTGLGIYLPVVLKKYQQ